MAFNAIYTPQNIRFETDEQKLRTRLGELRNMLKQANMPVDATTLEADRLKAGANAYMKYDVPAATEMLQKSEALATKGRTETEKKALQQIALDNVDKATQAWNDNKEDPNLRTALYNAINEARMTGVTVRDPIQQYINEKMAGSNIELRQQGLEQQGNYQQQQLSANAQREANDQWYRTQQLALEREKMDRAERKALKLTGDEAQKLGQLENAEPIFDRLEKKISEDLLLNTTADQINSPNKLIAMGANKLASSDTQAFANAKQMVRNMIGRDLSGAAISNHEWGAFEANIPAYGDTPEILAQKKKNRIDWINDKKNRGRTEQATPPKAPDKKPAPPVFTSNGRKIE